MGTTELERASRSSRYFSSLLERRRKKMSIIMPSAVRQEMTMARTAVVPGPSSLLVALDAAATMGPLGGPVGSVVGVDVGFGVGTSVGESVKPDPAHEAPRTWCGSFVRKYHF